MRDFMVDIECLGNTPGCAPFAIGAVGMDLQAGTLGPKFYELINVDSAVACGLSADYTWWDQQSPAARKALDEAKATDQTIQQTFHKFAIWMVSNFGEECRPWGCGAGFDQPILNIAHIKAKVRLPWRFWNEMCYRTIKNLNPQVQMTKRIGTYHNALDDAVSQAVHLLEIRGFHRDHILGLDVEEEEDLIG